jgi:hypothetical protein
MYQIDIELVKIPGQRKKYMWVTSLDGDIIEIGDSFYIFNAKRAARRAADRHAQGIDVESGLHYTEDYDPTA